MVEEMRAWQPTILEVINGKHYTSNPPPSDPPLPPPEKLTLPLEGTKIEQA